MLCSSGSSSIRCDSIWFDLSRAKVAAWWKFHELMAINVWLSFATLPLLLLWPFGQWLVSAAKGFVLKSPQGRVEQSTQRLERARQRLPTTYVCTCFALWGNELIDQLHSKVCRRKISSLSDQQPISNSKCLRKKKLSPLFFCLPRFN